MELEQNIKPYIHAVENGVKQKNWILSMMGSLSLIDICSSMSAIDGQTNGNKYAKWFDKYCTQYKVSFERNSNEPDKFTNIADYNNWMQSEVKIKGEMMNKEYTYFNGLLAYALRCSFLHNGSGEMSEQNVHKKAVENDTLGANDVVLDVSMESKVIEQIDHTIYLNPRHFCEEVIEGVYKWIEDNRKDSSTIENSNRTIKIKSMTYETKKYPSLGNDSD